MRQFNSAIIATSIALGLTFISGAATAQEAGAAQQETNNQNKQYEDTTTYDFQGDDVTGNLVKPSNENIQGQTHGKTSSLIDIRSDFIPEMLKSVEDL